MADFKVGDRVEAQWKSKGGFFKATIIGTTGPGLYDVKFDFDRQTTLHQPHTLKSQIRHLSASETDEPPRPLRRSRSKTPTPTGNTLSSWGFGGGGAGLDWSRYADSTRNKLVADESQEGKSKAINLGWAVESVPHPKKSWSLRLWSNGSFTEDEAELDSARLEAEALRLRDQYRREEERKWRERAQQRRASTAAALDEPESPQPGLELKPNPRPAFQAGSKGGSVPAQPELAPKDSSEFGTPPAQSESSAGSSSANNADSRTLTVHPRVHTDISSADSEPKLVCESQITLAVTPAAGSRDGVIDAAPGLAKVERNHEVQVRARRRSTQVPVANEKDSTSAHFSKFVGSEFASGEWLDGCPPVGEDTEPMMYESEESEESYSEEFPVDFGCEERASAVDATAMEASLPRLDDTAVKSTALAATTPKREPPHSSPPLTPRGKEPRVMAVACAHPPPYESLPRSVGNSTGAPATSVAQPVLPKEHDMLTSGQFDLGHSKSMARLEGHPKRRSHYRLSQLGKAVKSVAGMSHVKANKSDPPSDEPPATEVEQHGLSWTVQMESGGILEHASTGADELKEEDPPQSDKPWSCAVCGRQNKADDSVCSVCTAKRGRKISIGTEHGDDRQGLSSDHLSRSTHNAGRGLPPEHALTHRTSLKRRNSLSESTKQGMTKINASFVGPSEPASHTPPATRQTRGSSCEGELGIQLTKTPSGIRSSFGPSGKTGDSEQEASMRNFVGLVTLLEADRRFTEEGADDIRTVRAHPFFEFLGAHIIYKLEVLPKVQAMRQLHQRDRSIVIPDAISGQLRAHNFKHACRIMHWLARTRTMKYDTVNLDFTDLENSLDQIISHSANPLRASVLLLAAVNEYCETLASHKPLLDVLDSLKGVSRHCEGITKALLVKMEPADRAKVLMSGRPCALKVAVDFNINFFVGDPRVVTFIDSQWMGRYDADDYDSVFMAWKSAADICTGALGFFMPSFSYDRANFWDDLSRLWRKITKTMPEIISPHTILVSPVASFASEILTFFFLIVINLLVLELEIVEGFRFKLSTPTFDPWDRDNNVNADDQFDQRWTLLESCMLLTWLSFFLSECGEVRESIMNGELFDYLSSFWNQLDLAIHWTTCVYVVLRLDAGAPEPVIRPALIKFFDFETGMGEDGNEFEPWRCVLAWTACLLWLRLLNAFSVSRRLGSMVASLQIIIRDILVFSTIMFIMTLGFALVFSELFGTNTSGNNTFTSVSSSLFYLFLASIGDFEFLEDLKKDFHGTALVLFFLYLLCGTVMLFNLLIAVVTDTYESNVESNAADIKHYRHKMSEVFRFLQSPSSQGPPLNLLFLIVSPLCYILCITGKRRERLDRWVYDAFIGVQLLLLFVVIGLAWVLCSSPILLIEHSISESKDFLVRTHFLHGRRANESLTHWVACGLIKGTIMTIVATVLCALSLAINLVLSFISIPLVMLGLVASGIATYVGLITHSWRSHVGSTWDQLSKRNPKADDEFRNFSDGVRQRNKKYRYWEFKCEHGLGRGRCADCVAEAEPTWCLPDERERIFALYQRLLEMDKDKNGTVPFSQVSEELQAFFHPSAEIERDVRSGKDCVRAVMSFLQHAMHIDLHDIQSIDLRVANAQSMVASARCKLTTQRTANFRVRLLWLEEGHWEAYTELDDEVSVLCSENLHDESSMFQHLDQMLLGFSECPTVSMDIGESDPVRGVRISQLITFLLVNCPVDPAGRVLLDIDAMKEIRCVDSEKLMTVVINESKPEFDADSEWERLDLELDYLCRRIEDANQQQQASSTKLDHIFAKISTEFRSLRGVESKLPPVMKLNQPSAPTRSSSTGGSTVERRSLGSASGFTAPSPPRAPHLQGGSGPSAWKIDE